MKRALTGLRTAVAALTIVPMGVFEADPPAAVAWYPWVGWLYGAVGVGICSAASLQIGGPLGSVLVGLTVVAAWAGLSGLMHWDGLADTADGLLGGHTPERRLEIMADSATGAFGTVTVVLAVVAQVVGIAAVYGSGDWWAIGAAPVAGRLAAALCVYSRSPAREGGLGASAHARASVPAVAWALLAFALTLSGGIVSVATGAPVAGDWLLEHGALVVMALVVGHVASRSLTKPIGGYTGDVLGAIIVYTETAVLFVAAAWAASGSGW